MYDDVLVPTDGSPDADHAVEHALGVAGENDARIHALYVVDSTPHANNWAGVAGVPAVSPEAMPDESVLRNQGEATVESVADRASERGVECVTAVLDGRPHERILEYADEHDVDLIVMGTHGRSGIRRFLLGSVTETVVRAARVPVLTLRSEGTGTITDPDAAREAARKALECRGHRVVSVEDDPSRQRSSWVVRAESDGATFNVHVSTSGETSVARIRDGAA